MITKNLLRHEEKLQCMAKCRFYKKCISRNGKQCKHLGGYKIPVFKSLCMEDFEGYRVVDEYIRQK